MPHFLIAAAVGLVVAACASPTENRPLGDAPPADRRIRFTAPPLDAPAVRYRVFEDIWQCEDHAAFAAGGSRAEVILITRAMGQQVSLDFPFTVETSLATWVYTRDGISGLGPVERVEIGKRVVFLRPFRIAREDRSCFGFTSEWDRVAGDPNNRPGKALFGYVCAPPGGPLTATEARSIVLGLRTGAAVGAAGTAHTATIDSDFGNHGFPFRFARHFVIGNGNRSR